MKLTSRETLSSETDHPSLHIPNVGDALELDGKGVKGRLKSKVEHLLARFASYPVNGDSIILPQTVSPGFLAATEFVRGVKPRVIRASFDPNPDQAFKTAEWTSAIAENLNSPETRLDPFILSKSIYDIAEQTGTKVRGVAPDIAEELIGDINDKASFVNRCNRLGIPVPRLTQVLTDHNFLPVKDLLGEQGRVMMRKARCGGGLGNLIVTKNQTGYAFDELNRSGLTWEEADQIISEWMNCTQDPLVIAPFANQVASYTNLVYVPAQGEPRVISTNQQIFDANTKYIGFQSMENSFKASSEDYALRFARDLQKAGFQDAFFDLDSFVPAEQPDQLWYVECNGRKNGNMHILAYLTSLIGHKNDRTLVSLAEHPEVPAVVSRDVVPFIAGTTFEQVMELFKQAGLLYGFNRPDDGLIVTIPPANDGVMGLATFAKDLPAAQQTMEQTLNLLAKQK
jgi:hypothetical protein